MKVAGVARPLGCLSAALRRARIHRTQARYYATELRARPFQDLTAFSTRQQKDLQRAKRFEIYPALPSVRKEHANPMPELRAKQIAQLDPSGARTRLFSREHADSAKVGDVLMVTTERGEPFSGAFIQIRRSGADTAILLRGQLMKTSVETWFKIYSPTTRAIDIIWRRPKRARRARLTYMRKPKHDMGNVDHLVFAWKQERTALRSRAGGQKGGKGNQKSQKSQKKL